MALHNDYRPTRLSDVYGQDHNIQILKNAAISGRISEYQALLFTGTRGAGKTTTARILAHLVNCLNPVDGEPCMECKACKMVSYSLAHGGDIVEMDAASKSGKDDIDQLLQTTHYHANLPLTKRVYILDEAHQLSNAAKDRLLKTLEEPPSHVVFILATTESQKIPLTIGSRCIKFHFKEGTPADIAGYLKAVLDSYGVEYEEDALVRVGQLALGSYRDALGLTEKLVDASDRITMSAIDQALCLPGRDVVMKAVRGIITGDQPACIRVVAEVANQGKDVRLFLREVLEMLLRGAVAMAEKNVAKSPEGLRIKDIVEIGNYIHAQAGVYSSELSGLIPGLILAGAAEQARSLKSA